MTTNKYNLLVRTHFIIVMIRWTGLAPWEFECPFPQSNLCRRFLGEVLLCVTSLHSKGIIHRDLKVGGCRVWGVEIVQVKV